MSGWRTSAVCSPLAALYSHGITVLPAAAVGEPVFMDANNLVQRHGLRRGYGLRLPLMLAFILFQKQFLRSFGFSRIK
jgi:hypothetical protein